MGTERPQGRPRSRSMMSFGSHRSQGSAGKFDKIDLVESPKEKASRKMHTKADPTMAMTEAQPATQALEKSTMESIRNLQHKDMYGNIITDPDRSNPTRPRLERPLDTIRSFEAAIDGSYSKRFSTRPESTIDPATAQSRRSSYFMGYNNHSAPQRFPGDTGGYYGNGNRSSYARPESNYMENGNGSSPNGQYNGHYNGHYYPRQPRQSSQFGPRTHSDPALYGNNAQQYQVYPVQGYQQSNDTVTTTNSGNTSQGTDQWGNSTDPSSENSSIDKVQHAPKPDLAEVYGFSGFGGAPQFQGPILEEFDQGSPEYGQPGYGHANGHGKQPAYQGNGVPPQGNGAPLQRNGVPLQGNGVPLQGNGVPPQGNGAPPPPPRHGYAPRDVPPPPPVKGIQSRSRTKYANGSIPMRQDSRPDSGEKRKSWLKRTFSRNG